MHSALISCTQAKLQCVVATLQRRYQPRQLTSNHVYDNHQPRGQHFRRSHNHAPNHANHGTNHVPTPPFRGGNVTAKPQLPREHTMTHPTPTLNPNIPGAHQPGHDPEWCGYLAGEAAKELRTAGHDALAAHVEDLERWHARHNPQHLYGPKETP